MLELRIPAGEFYDYKSEEFIEIKEVTLRLEHSLVSLAKWESKWHKPFLKVGDVKTDEETLDYIRCMTITQNVDPNVYAVLDSKTIEMINEYIDNPMTATTFSSDSESSGASGRGKVYTAEIIYYWMITLNIPFECQKWHLNRLLTLIRVLNIKSQPKKKMSRRELAMRNKELNEARRRKYNTKG